MVTISFLYPAVKGKDDQYYKDKAFGEIYNSNDVLDGDNFLVEDYDLENTCGICGCMLVGNDCPNCNGLV